MGQPESSLSSTATAHAHAGIRNVAIIAHVDHGKTTLVDGLLKQSGMFRAGELDKLAGGQHNLIMDSNPLERERGITILSKNCAIVYHTLDGEEIRINIIDTPGHADFGGEVERVLRMADGCLMLVDAFDGPMPQTKFVLGKALEFGLKPLVVVNKCDRPGARPDDVVHEVFDLLVELGAEDIALDFRTIYASAREGWASNDWREPGTDLRPILEAIVEEIPAPKFDANAPLQMLVTTLDYSEFVGRIGIGRVFAGTIRKGQRVAMIHRDGTRKDVRIGQLMQFSGLGRVEAEEIYAGDLCAVFGIEGVDIGNTLADISNPVALPPVKVDEPTMTMLFRINDSPFSGKEGKYLTSRQIRDRLDKETEKNVAMRWESGNTADEFLVAGRGTLHLGILIETMRREGFELSIGKPHVILKEIDGVVSEPVEELVVDVPNHHVGKVMELIGARKGEMIKMEPRGDTITHLVFEITSRALIGLRSRVLTATQGEGIMHHRYSNYVPMRASQSVRDAGVLISTETGSVTSHAAELLADRGVLFVTPGDAVYKGQIVGEHCRDNDLTVNICRLKALSNIRVASKEATVVLKGARKLSLEEAIEYVEDDELVEITPTSVRLRKRLLEESDRKREERRKKDKDSDSN
ncbi:MAG: translational GTPase TypA [Phycisphaeraceae bacterium]|nr:translational GTPase TypA [Phycisphaerales bacterium]MCB9860181.1 translational GTPase TypA [Phycisphaeraceae bacterium]